MPGPGISTQQRSVGPRKATTGQMPPLRQIAHPPPACPAVSGKEQDWEFTRRQAALEQLQGGVQGNGAEGPTLAEVLRTLAGPLPARHPGLMQGRAGLGWPPLTPPLPAPALSPTGLPSPALTVAPETWTSRSW